MKFCANLSIKFHLTDNLCVKKHLNTPHFPLVLRIFQSYSTTGHSILTTPAAYSASARRTHVCGHSISGFARLAPYSLHR